LSGNSLVSLTRALCANLDHWLDLSGNGAMPMTTSALPNP
jgi:hypothetical protein